MFKFFLQCVIVLIIGVLANLVDEKFRIANTTTMDTVVAVFVIFFGVMMARSAMVAVNASLPVTNPFRRHTLVQEAMFWILVVSGGYGFYLLLTSV